MPVQRSSTIGLNIEEYVKVAGLLVGYMQFIEIAREIDKTGLKLLVFDEPTVVLDRRVKQDCSKL